MIHNQLSLVNQAKEVLQQNWTGKATKPAPRLYPHQWSWDSAFIAMGYAHYHQEQAMQELRSLFRGQWSNGLLPHIVFRPGLVGAYFPGPDYWQTERSPHAPQAVATSGIVQPPVHATAALHIYRHATDPAQARAFLTELFPKLVAWHQYLYRDRNPEGNGLVYIRHPWESGQDNSPLWDAVMERILPDPSAIPAYQRVDTHEVNISNRPSNLDYDRYVYLMVKARQHDYHETNLRADCPFMVQDVLFNTLLVQSSRDLGAIAQILHHDPAPYLSWANQTANSLNHKLWNSQLGLYQNYDLVAQTPIAVKVAAGFLPLYAQVPDATQAATMLAAMHSSGFRFNQGWMIPTCSRHEAAFCHERYWRGPVWINLNWLLCQGLRHYGFVHEAANLKAASIELVERAGFHEYFSPVTGEGLGSANFSWTAALLLDFLMEESAVRPLQRRA
ncbi:amylo-alpha-1,6-glucosidase [Leptolyngbya sp. AN02str]|uniref:amylo-alpha-1,6-glucosidase n=1 Tax=Leptolyngbya sp. AN02str TaxID=3423363 RepID=UPI003D3127B7